jgi:hypothetical protein
VTSAFARLAPLARFAALLPFVTGCSVIVLSDAAGAVCDDNDDCGAGFVCAEGACAEADIAAIPTEGFVDVDGGVVSGHGVTLTVPAGAMSRSVVFVIEPRSATVAQDNVEASVAPVRIEPTITFVTSATLSFVGDGALFRQRGDNDALWERLADDGDEVEIAQTGTFLLGTEIVVDDDDDDDEEEEEDDDAGGAP